MKLRKRACIALPLALLMLGGSFEGFAWAHGHVITECMPTTEDDEGSYIELEGEWKSPEGKVKFRLDFNDVLDAAGEFWGNVWDWLTGGGGGGSDGGGEPGGNDGGGETGGNDGGDDGGGSDGGGEPGGNDGGEPGGETPTGGDAPTEEESSSVESCPEVFEQAQDAFEVESAEIRDNILTVKLVEHDHVTFTKLHLGRPIPVPNWVRRQYRLRGDWYVQPGDYEVNNRTINLILVRR